MLAGTNLGATVNPAYQDGYAYGGLGAGADPQDEALRNLYLESLSGTDKKEAKTPWGLLVVGAALLYFATRK